MAIAHPKALEAAYELFKGAAAQILIDIEHHNGTHPKLTPAQAAQEFLTLRQAMREVSHMKTPRHV